MNIYRRKMNFKYPFKKKMKRYFKGEVFAIRYFFILVDICIPLILFLFFVKQIMLFIVK